QDSSLSLAATTASATINPAVVGERTTMVLDGARIKADSAGSGTFDDYLAGVTTLVLGENGVNIDTCGNDVTILQTLTPTGGSTTAGLVKTGEGTLKLGGKSNWMFGPLVVSNGTLKAGFDTGIHRLYPEGAMALWTFDGDNPYEDKTGHGYDLEQTRPGDANFADVTFKSENAMTGKAAFFSESKKCSLKASNITSTTFARQTVSAWVRLKDGSRSRGNAGIVSTRVKADFSATGNYFDLAYKLISKTNNVDVVGKNTGFGTIWGNAQATIWDSVVGRSPSVGEWHHVLMVNDDGVYSSYLDGVCYVDRYAGTSIKFLESGYLITIGQGIATSEFMEPGGMIDEVAIYPRALSAAEIEQIYSGAAKEPVFPVTVCEGAVWDMNSSTAKVTSVTGAGSITNGQLTVEQGICFDLAAQGVLHIDNPCFATAEGTLDLGFPEDVKAPLDTPIELFTFDEISAESAANLEKWSVTGLGLRGEMRKVSISVDIEDGVVYATVQPTALFMIVR
ncbi:MAG: LamG domain-containing protein, partial [Kiritimatiellae bacterium]|nr:LamG domain-containing protein [Kiritimatiellia bacterium]